MKNEDKIEIDRERKETKVTVGFIDREPIEVSPYDWQQSNFAPQGYDLEGKMR